MNDSDGPRRAADDSAADSADDATTAFAIVSAILADMGHREVSASDTLVAMHGDSAAALGTTAEFNRFMRGFAITRGCLPYPLDAIEAMTVGEFCDLHRRDSHPDIPAAALHGDAFSAEDIGPPRRMFAPRDLPICFVLGCARSGTTLFRSMLNIHDELWAPGELHLAEFDTMAERVARTNPYLRHALVPEAAARFGESSASFSARLADWEKRAVPVPEVYRLLHDADSARRIVDKTPSYSNSIRDLEWITSHFPEARFVHLVRNPPDVIRSFVRMRLHDVARAKYGADLNPYHVAELAWFRNNANIETMRRSVPTSRFLRVRYEDLVANPTSILGSVCELLDVAFDPRMADPYRPGSGPIARGAGDPRVDLATEIERRPRHGASHPLGAASVALGARYGY